MSRVKDPALIAEKQVRRTSEAIPDMEEGIKAVTTSPTELAAQNLDVAKANYSRAIESGKMARNLRAVTLADWQSKTLAKVGRVAEGVREAQPTIQAFHTQRNAAQVNIDRDLAKVQKRTLADSIRRVTIQIEGMSKFSFDRSKR